MRERSNSEWTSALAAGGRIEDAALADLRGLLLAAIAGFLARRGALAPDDAASLAEDCVQEALLRIRASLDQFRGESRFTTWAYTIATRIALGELRRRRWRGAALDQAAVGETIPAWPIDDPGPERSLAQRQAWGLLTELIEQSLTPLQRKAVIACAFQEMPLDEAAAWLGTNRNSLYKLIHDARKKLKAALVAKGLTHRDLVAIFETPRPERPYPIAGKDLAPRDVS